jgi:ketosteroid isomerase-like protein
VSRENVDLLRRYNDAYRRGDWDALAAAMDPHVFVRTDPRWPEPRFYGRDALIAFWRGLWESLGWADVHIEDIADLGDRVLARLVASARGDQSGVSVEQSVSELATIRDGRVIFIEYFLDHADALRAVGLEE